MPNCKPIPHLPADFLRKLNADPMMADYESAIYSSEFQDVRLAIVDHKDEMGPDNRSRVKLPDGMTLDHIPNAMNATFAHIHLAAICADPHYLCEMIRLGADMDLEESGGNTPLMLAMQNLVAYLTFARYGLPFPGASASGGTTPPIIKRLAFIARTLIEQHADVNLGAGNGMMPLHCACRAQDWELIALLLKHGAKVSITDSKLVAPIDMLPSARDKSRFIALVKSLSWDGKRPAQPCPCWSGKMLADCHANHQPYPADFYCVCGSKKSYGKCCSRRNMVLFEKWNKEKRYLNQMSLRFAGPSAISEASGGRNVLKTTGDMVNAIHISMPREFLDANAMSEEDAWHFLQRMGVELVSRGLIDFAYAYAMKEVQFLPR